jgi:hypothetical protein
MQLPPSSSLFLNNSERSGEEAIASFAFSIEREETDKRKLSRAAGELAS